METETIEGLRQRIVNLRQALWEAHGAILTPETRAATSECPPERYLSDEILIDVALGSVQFALTAEMGPPCEIQDDEGTAMSNREALGRLVREVWAAWASEVTGVPRDQGLPSWDKLDTDQPLDIEKRELCMRIGEAVAAAEHERIAKLAEQEAAKCDPGDLPTISGPVAAAELRHLADMIRKEGPDAKPANNQQR